MVAASVLPSPVFISAIFPSCKTMPPMICSSKGRIPSVRRETSRTAAKASGSRSSMVSPFASLSRNSSVFSRNCASESFSMSGSSAETVSTRFWRALTLRPSPILKIFVNKLAKTSYLMLFGRGGLTGRLYEPVVSVTTPVYHIYVAGIGAREHVEVVVEELELEHGLLRAHRLHLELFGPHNAGCDLLFFLHDEGLLHFGDRLGRVLQLALPAVDLAPPKALDLPLELVRHPVDGSVHVFGGLTGLEHGPVDKQRALGHLGLGDGAVPLVDELHLGPRGGALVVEEPGDPLHLLPRVALERLRHRDVAAVDVYVHVAPPFGRRGTLASPAFSTLRLRLRLSARRFAPCQQVSASNEALHRRSTLPDQAEVLTSGARRA